MKKLKKLKKLNPKQWRCKLTGCGTENIKVVACNPVNFSPTTGECMNCGAFYKVESFNIKWKKMRGIEL